MFKVNDKNTRTTSFTFFSGVMKWEHWLIYHLGEKMTRCAIWYHLVQFKKREKYLWRSVTFMKVVGFHKFSIFF